MSVHSSQGVAALFMALCFTCLSACSGGGGGGGAPDTAPPTFGGAALALALTDTSIDVQWAAATDNLDPSSAILYNVYLSRISGGQNLSSPDVTTPPAATSQAVGSLLPGTTYFFIVRAEDTSGNEDVNIVEVMATTLALPDTTPPMFIGVASAMALSPTGIQLDWAAATDDTALPSQILYNIYWATISGGQSFIAPNETTPPGTISHVATGLLADTEYFFVVRAEDPSGNEDTNLVELSATTLPDSTPPIFGGATGAMALSDTMIEVSWAAATDDSDPASAIVYNLYMALVSGGQNFAVPTVTSAPGATMHIIGGLLPLTDYFVVVRAEDTAGNEETNLIEVMATTLPMADTTPPVFLGIASATTSSPTEIQLDWVAATDDVALPGQIIYNIYWATTPGGQDFLIPNDTTPPGTISHLVTGLLPDTDYFFVVRAEDPSGNEETNIVEASDKTLVSFSTQVQPIFTNNCIFCHGPPLPTEGMELTSYATIDATAINVVANEPLPLMDRIEPFDSTLSYLVHKIDGTQVSVGGSGLQMPWGGPALPLAQRDIIRAWVNQGALNN